MNKGYIFLIVGLVVSLSLTLYMADYTGYLYKIPKVGNYLLSYKYEWQAKKYSPESFQYNRLQAMAEALRKGENQYTFEISGPQAQMLNP
jgi:hypothetical protein